MAERTKAEFPEEYALIQAYAEGASEFIRRRNEGLIAKTEISTELLAFKEPLDPWTPVDTMTVVRLLTWQLGFGGAVDEEDMLSISKTIQDAYDGTPLEGLEMDVYELTPSNLTATLPIAANKPGKAPSGFNLGAALQHPLLKKSVTAKTLEAMRSIRDEVLSYPHQVMRGPDYGSNNWVISGDFTESGKPLVANDTHLSLSNPSVFHQVHLSTVAAGGDYEVSGVQFAAAPGIAVGTNGHIAWGATVFFSDVTDAYVEDIQEDWSGVTFNGQVVPFDVREEVFTFVRSGLTCDEAISSWIANLDTSVTEGENAVCTLTINVRDVPHHGPMIPWTIGKDEEGKPIGMSWKWTGFEPTDDLIAFVRANEAKTWDEFKSAMDNFGVGAQNFVYGDTEGNIGWYPSHRLPIRANIEAGDYSHPPFLPMPGDGSCEWNGYVPRSELPQGFNPPQGYMVTANSDPLGTTFDGDPFNDGHYIGAHYAAGFRMAQASKRVAELVKSDSPVTVSDMNSVHADHHSNLGARMRSHLIAAMNAAADGTDSAAAALWTDKMSEIRTLLENWTLNAASGFEAETGSTDALDSAATAVFNVWVTYLIDHTFDETGLGSIGDNMRSRLILKMLEGPELMKTFDPITGESRLWDKPATANTIESKAQIMMMALTDAVAWLSNSEKIGVSQNGGFGTDDINQWRWGQLHTLTLRHNLVSSYNIPPPEEHPAGFPRPGDMFSVDASHPGMTGRNFTYGHGPAIRQVMRMTTPVWRSNVIPGGQSEIVSSPHYRDQMDLWWRNETAAVPYTVDAVVAETSDIWDFEPAEK
jgi:penicillin amidase